MFQPRRTLGPFGWRQLMLLMLAVGPWIGGCHAEQGPSYPEGSEGATPLPLEKLRLYDSGVAYFERAGKLEQGAGSTVPVPAAHIDDALKTLIVLGDGGSVRVSSVEFQSILGKGLARVLAGIPVGTGEPIRYADVLGSLRGLEVTVALLPDRGDDRIVGTLLEVTPLASPKAAGRDSDEAGADGAGEATGEDASAAEATDGAPPASLEDFQLTLLTLDGGIRRLNTTDVESVHPTDKMVAKRLGLAALTLSKRAAQLERGLHLVAESDAEVRIGYVAEAPVWRATYRLVVPDKGKKSALQGWALLHNDTDEAWQDVTVELVSGRPDSFLFPLAAPRYLRRPLAKPAEVLSTAPQLSRFSADELWGEYIETEVGDNYGYGGLGLSGIGEGGGGHGEGISLSSIGTLGHGAGGRDEFTRGSDEISIGNLAEIEPAVGEEGLALYSYRLPSSVAVRPHGSALVPFLSRRVEAERISWVVAGQGVRSAAVLTNSTRNTLPSGTLAVYDSRGFIGETGFERMKPQERQLLRFGFDLDLELDQEQRSRSEETQLLRFKDRRVERHYLRYRQVTYSIENRSGLPRSVFFVLGVGDNTKIEGADALDYFEGEGGAVAVFHAAPAGVTERTLDITEALVDSKAPEALDTRTLDELAVDPAVSPGQRAVLERARGLVSSIEGARAELQEMAEKQRDLDERQRRLHQHERRLKSGDEAPEAIVTRILALEDELQALAETEKRKQAAVEALESRLAELLAELPDG